MTTSTVSMPAPPTPSESRLPLTRTRQAFDRSATVEWMVDSGVWGVSYPISGDALTELKATAKRGETAGEFSSR